MWLEQPRALPTEVDDGIRIPRVTFWAPAEGRSERISAQC